MKKLLISLTLSALILLALPGQLNRPALAYDDVTENSPYFYAVEYLRRNDVFANTKKFSPDTIINKAEFIKYLVKLNAPDFQTGKKIKLPFSDTQDAAWYAPYFSEAITLGILDGRITKAEPYKKITLMEALELLFHSQSIPIPTRYVGEVPFKDLKQNQSAQPLVMRALEFDLIIPQNQDNIGIYRRITRAEAALMIYRMDLVNLTPPSKQLGQNYEISLQKIIDTWGLVQDNFLKQDQVNAESMSNAAIQAMLETLGDPYTSYMNAEQNQAFSDDLDGEIEGIGAYIAVDEITNAITIIAPIKGSPAEKAGILAGDVIKKVDNEDTAGLSLYEVVGKIKGKKGTAVQLTVQRNGQTLTIKVTRDVVKIASLANEIKDGNIMYLSLAQFGQNSANEFGDAVSAIQANPNIKGVILDLRDNPGGLLDTAVGILNYLLPQDSPIVTIQYSNFSYTQYSTRIGELSQYPMAVLINAGSASASEIVAGAVQDLSLGTLIGETSFGKGTVQEVNYFNDASSIKLTVAKWLTPNGTSIQDGGITPDIIVTKPKGSTDDPQLARALVEVKRLINAK